MSLPPRRAFSTERRNMRLSNLCQTITMVPQADWQTFLRVLANYHTPVTADLVDALKGAAAEILDAQGGL